MSQACNNCAGDGCALCEQTGTQPNAPPATTEEVAPIRCPECGNTDLAKFQISLPAWFRVKPEYLQEKRTFARRSPWEIIFLAGEHIDTDVEARGSIYCEACDHVSDEGCFKPERVAGA